MIVRQVWLFLMCDWGERTLSKVNSNFNLIPSKVTLKVCEEGKQIEIQSTTIKEPCMQVMGKYLIKKHCLFCLILEKCLEEML